jgi:hypothetical protein
MVTVRYLHPIAPIPLVKDLGSVSNQAINARVLDAGHMPDKPGN